MLTLREAVYAIVLALFLMAGAMLFEPRQWSLLFGVLLLLTLLLPRLAAAMGNEIRDEYRFAMVRPWEMWRSFSADGSSTDQQPENSPST